VDSGGRIGVLAPADVLGADELGADGAAADAAADPWPSTVPAAQALVTPATTTSSAPTTARHPTLPDMRPPCAARIVASPRLCSVRIALINAEH
jgi:hypothetical protein